MPGVPSGRACDACRTVRKKCDATVPCCSRCVRLNIICVGSGQRRFQFKGPKCDRTPPSQAKHVFKLQQLPSSPTQLLVASLLKCISLETEYRFSLLHAYGPFLAYLPQRLGISEALDSAAQALVLSHHDMCSKQSVSVHATIAYNTGIQKLRRALDEPMEATSVHSLGAAALLVMCRDMNGYSIKDWEIHSLGAAEILHARRHVRSQDDFECQLLTNLQGYLVGHCVFSRSMRLNPDRFEKLVEPFANDSESDNILRYIYIVPRLLQRGRMLCNDSEAMQRLIQEIAAAYDALTELRHAQRVVLDTDLPRGSIPRFQALGGYAVTLSLCSIYHCMLSGHKYGRGGLQGGALAEAILCLAQEVEDLSPLGSAYMFLALPLAWLCAEDDVTKHLIRSALHDLQHNYHRGVRVEALVLRMEELRHDLRFQTQDFARSAIEAVS